MAFAEQVYPAFKMGKQRGVRAKHVAHILFRAGADHVQLKLADSVCNTSRMPSNNMMSEISAAVSLLKYAPTCGNFHSGKPT